MVHFAQKFIKKVAFVILLLVVGMVKVRDFSFSFDVGNYYQRSSVKETNKFDGKFNGFDLTYVNETPYTSIHCVGENFDETRSWLYRSCKYSNLCFDVQQQKFVIFRKNAPYKLQKHWWSSTQMKSEQTFVAAGSQPMNWFPKIKNHSNRTIGRFQPSIIQKKKHNVPSSFYRLNATMLLFYQHPTSYRNPGHLQWDDFLPLYTLLDIFDRTDDNLYLARMRRSSSLEPNQPFDIFEKFLPMMGLSHNYQVDITKGFDLQINKNQTKTDKTFVCANYGLVGDGLFSDHGENHWHGQNKEDFVHPLNTGRGGLFRRFRSFIMKNLGIDPNTPARRKPLKIVVSQSSSNKHSRANLTFDVHMEALRQEFPSKEEVEIRPVHLASMTLSEQIGLTSDATVFITAVGGGSSTAMFLPKGAHLILFYARGRGYLDWDFWNNFPHVHVHWIEYSTSNKIKFKDRQIDSHPKEIAKFVKRILSDDAIE